MLPFPAAVYALHGAWTADIIHDSSDTMPIGPLPRRGPGVDVITVFCSCVK